MRQRWNGSIQSFNTPTYNSPGIAREDYNLYRCLVTKVLYTDDDSNITKNSANPEVLYEVVILGGSSAGQALSNVRLSSYLAGDYSFFERTLRPTTKNLSKEGLSKHDGDVVLVQFIQGHDGYPVIIGMSNGLHQSSGTKKSEGPRMKSKFNGLIEEINKTGEYSIIRNGGSSSEGLFTENTEFEAKFRMVDGQIVLEDKKTKLTLFKTDKITMTTTGGASITLDGSAKNVSIKAGTTEVLIDQNSGKISLKGDLIDLGASTTDFVTLFTALLSAFNSHTHQYTDDGVPAMSAPPTAPLLQSVGSQTVKVQS